MEPILKRKLTLEDNGVPVPASTYLYKTPARVAAVDADLQDAINDGVIVISSAGNSYWNCDTSSGNDYDNAIHLVLVEQYITLEVQHQVRQIMLSVLDRLVLKLLNTNQTSVIGVSV